MGLIELTLIALAGIVLWTLIAAVGEWFVKLLVGFALTPVDRLHSYAFENPEPAEAMSGRLLIRSLFYAVSTLLVVSIAGVAVMVLLFME